MHLFLFITATRGWCSTILTRWRIWLWQCGIDPKVLWSRAEGHYRIVWREEERTDVKSSRSWRLNQMHPEWHCVQCWWNNILGGKSSFLFYPYLVFLSVWAANDIARIFLFVSPRCLGAWGCLSVYLLLVQMKAQSREIGLAQSCSFSSPSASEELLLSFSKKIVKKRFALAFRLARKVSFGT